MRVLRIERRDGSGPYTGRYAPAMAIFFRGNLWSEQPAPYDDGIISWDYRYHFGFKSDDQLLAWFNPSHEDAYEQLVRMAEEDFVIVEYNCYGLIIEGRHQVAFERNRAVKLNELPLSQLVS